MLRSPKEELQNVSGETYRNQREYYLMDIRDKISTSTEGINRINKKNYVCISFPVSLHSKVFETQQQKPKSSKGLVILLEF